MILNMNYKWSHKKHFCIQLLSILPSVLLMVMVTKAPFSFAQTCTGTNNEDCLSAKDKLFVRKFVLDGMSWFQLNQKPERKARKKSQNCFEKAFEKVKNKILQSENVNLLAPDEKAKSALIRVYQDNRKALQYACWENVRKGDTNATTDCRKIKEAKPVVETRIENARIVMLNVNCSMTAEQIQAAKNDITRFYIDNKYINSGAMIPDQAVTGDGIIVIRVVEGWLKDVEVKKKPSIQSSESSNTKAEPSDNPPDKLHLSTAYIKRRLLFDEDAQGHLNMGDLQERLQIMQQNPLFKQIVARVAPGKELGEGILKTEVLEEAPLKPKFRFNNYRHPSVGAYRGAIELDYSNILSFPSHLGILSPNGYGLGDSLYLRYGLTKGLRDYAIRYGVPFPLPWVKYDTTLSMGFDKSDSEVVTEPFSSLDVESDSETWSATLRHPFYKSYPRADDPNNPSAYQEFALALRLESRHNTTYLEGKPFPFSPGAIEGETKYGETKYGVMRLVQEWLSRGQYNVFAFYNTFSFGMDTLGSSKVDDKINERGFFVWLGQFQWFGRFNQLKWNKDTLKHSWPRLWESSLLFRTNVQMAVRELLSLEKFALGGHASVRGYRESELLRDNGFTASLEWHIPIFHLPIPWISKPGDGKIHLMPFIDYGRGWNDAEDSTPDPKDIYSVGIGLQYVPHNNIQAQLYYGHAFRKLEKSTGQDEHDLQDDGIHFEFQMSLWPW
jgi:hemolysin activation/secretion protein